MLETDKKQAPHTTFLGNKNKACQSNLQKQRENQSEMY